MGEAKEKARANGHRKKEIKLYNIRKGQLNCAIKKFFLIEEVKRNCSLLVTYTNELQFYI